DLYKNEWNYFKETVFPHTTFFHFKSKSFSWYFLDTGNLTLGINQYTALEKALKNDNSQKLIFSHIPLYSNGEFYASPQDTIERNLLISLFKKTNVKMYFAGHTHNYSYSDIGFIEYVVPGFLEKGQWALLKINENSSNLDVTICP
ncbi:MAG: metallophosphoesterase, partial [Treponema sp.]|nr:metallophosphoesterase [Treponema sp.]